MGRPSKDVVWMKVAREVSQLGTCPRRKVGAVIVAADELVASGYNGAPRGESHCDGAGCEMEHGHCVRAVHAELNALLQAARRGRETSGATLYTTASPCRRCMAAIMNCGVRRVVYLERYKDQTHQGDAAAWALEAAKRANITMDLLVLADDHPRGGCIAY